MASPPWPRLADAIGAKGGIFSGPVPGAAGPLRFNNPRGVGLDVAGNLYVANDGTTAGGGTVLESYGPARELRWRRHGLHFVDLPDIDPLGRTVYTKEEIYDLAYQPAGRRASGRRRCTCDSRRYPDDPRAHGSHTNAWFRELGVDSRSLSTAERAVRRSLRHLPLRPQDYAGEIAIPAPASLAREEARASGLRSRARRRRAGWRWQDLDGDGAMQAGEFAAE